MKKDVLIYFDLINSMKTTQEVSALSSEIDILLAAIWKSEEITLEKALSAISASTHEKIMQAFSKNNLDIINKEVVRDFLDNLKELITKFQVIKLTLAFEPSRKTIDKIFNLVKDSIGSGYILDIDVDESLLGGAVVIFNGKYKDFTLKKTIEDTFADKNSEIFKLVQ